MFWEASCRTRQSWEAQVGLPSPVSQARLHQNSLCWSEQCSPKHEGTFGYCDEMWMLPGRSWGSWKYLPILSFEKLYTPSLIFNFQLCSGLWAVPTWWNLERGIGCLGNHPVRVLFPASSYSRDACFLSWDAMRPEAGPFSSALLHTKPAKAHEALHRNSGGALL